MKVLKITAAIYFGLLALGVGLQFLPLLHAQERSETRIEPVESAPFPEGVGYLGANLGIGTANNNVGTGLGFGGRA